MSVVTVVARNAVPRDALRACRPGSAGWTCSTRGARWAGRAGHRVAVGARNAIVAGRAGGAGWPGSSCSARSACRTGGASRTGHGVAISSCGSVVTRLSSWTLRTLGASRSRGSCYTRRSDVAVGASFTFSAKEYREVRYGLEVARGVPHHDARCGEVRYGCDVGWDLQNSLPYYALRR